MDECTEWEKGGGQYGDHASSVLFVAWVTGCVAGRLAASGAWLDFGWWSGGVVDTREGREELYYSFGPPMGRGTI